jgi:bifunctional non-homologous end joining protein LigD
MTQNLPMLVWLAQLANIELHPWLSQVNPEPDGKHLSTHFTGSEAAIDASTLNYPDFMIFDLDPYIYSGKEAPGQEPELNVQAYDTVRKLALALKTILEDLSLTPFLKTSGKTGLHVYVPVMRQYDYDVIRKFCATVGQFLRSSLPSQVTMDWTVDRRKGKVFFDHNQNSRGKTLAAPYSLRPTPEATVSTPITWQELESVYPTDFTIATVPARLGRIGDPWAEILQSKHDLQALFEEQAESKLGGSQNA